jgi:frataxin-like iron-binding protein CyaY
MSDVVVNKQQGRWTQWVDFTLGPMRFQKQRGRWQFQWDGSYLGGRLPGPQDFANAGVH